MCTHNYGHDYAVHTTRQYTLHSIRNSHTLLHVHDTTYVLLHVHDTTHVIHIYVHNTAYAQYNNVLNWYIVHVANKDCFIECDVGCFRNCEYAQTCSLQVACGHPRNWRTTS